MYPQDRDEARSLARKLQGAETSASEARPPHAPQVTVESEDELRRRLPLTEPVRDWHLTGKHGLPK